MSTLIGIGVMGFIAFLSWISILWLEYYSWIKDQLPDDDMVHHINATRRMAIFRQEETENPDHEYTPWQ